MKVPLLVVSPTTYTARPPVRKTREASASACPISHTYLASRAWSRIERAGLRESCLITDLTQSASSASSDDTSAPTLSPRISRSASTLYPIHTSENLLHLM